MLHRKWQYPLLFFVGVAMWAIAGLLLLIPTNSVEAQCGTQASSCLSCHEVQGEMPVNSDGTGWHESHAFGDFCYICHAGNQQATTAEEAHAGMVHPLSDTKASCQMCHAADLDARAEVYAVALDYDLSGGGEAASSEAASSEAASGEAASGEAASSEAAEEPQAAEPAAVVNSNVDCVPADTSLAIDDPTMVDYKDRYAEIVLGKRDVNWGNMILIVAIGAVVIFGGAFLVVNEVVSNTVLHKPIDGEYPKDVVEMLPALSALKVQTRASLGRILTNPKKADKVLGVLGDVVADEDKEA